MATPAAPKTYAADGSRKKRDSDSSASAEWQHQLEVAFVGETGHHHQANEPNFHDGYRHHRSNSTSCFVHSLLGLPDDSSPQLQEVEVPTHETNPVQSRLLTKKELSEMAWNLRMLSKKLGSIKLKLNVHSVFLIAKKDRHLVKLTRELAQWLLASDREAQYIVYVEKRLETDKEFDTEGLHREVPHAEERLRFMDLDDPNAQSHIIDFIITLGGDGTVLYASWLFQRVVPPVLSFALGSLGFLTKFDFHNYQNVLLAAFCEGITVSLRLRLECTIMRSKKMQATRELVRRDMVEELVGQDPKDPITHGPEKTYQILNDIVVDRGPNPTMSSLEIFGDDQYFTSIQADGVCIATPTGSTAYNLAAGGSLCHPENPVVLLTAICAHTLNFRPIILPDTIVLRVGVPYDARTSSWASFDGRERVELNPGDYVTITASRFPFANVMPGKRSHDWIESISRTLNWNTRQKQQRK